MKDSARAGLVVEASRSTLKVELIREHGSGSPTEVSAGPYVI